MHDSSHMPSGGDQPRNNNNEGEVLVKKEVQLCKMTTKQKLSVKEENSIFALQQCNKLALIFRTNELFSHPLRQVFATRQDE